MTQLRIGADPEFFLKKDNKFVSAFDVIPGTKQQPFPVRQGAVQVDGLAVEFNIHPAKNSNEFVGNINTVLARLREMVPPDFDFSLAATADFEEDHMKSQPYEATILGCDPDFNAYTMDYNPPPDGNSLMRSAAGHIHLGWSSGEDVFDQVHFEKCANLTKQLDCILGVDSIIKDPDTRRRQLYGKAGAFRPKPYGVEYRVLSNFWLKSQKDMVSVFNTATIAFNDFERGLHYHDALSKAGFDVQDIINNTKIDAAYEANQFLYGKVIR